MENPPIPIWVVAAAVFDTAGRLLLQRCLPGKRNAGCWEFPGGKAENRENPRFALCRELMEELGIELDSAVLQPAGFAEEALDSGEHQIVMLLYTCSSWRGEPEGREGQEWRWFTLDQAAELPLPPMDRALLTKLAAEAIAKPDRPAYVAPSKRARSSAG